MEFEYDKTMITINEAALLTGVHPQTIYNWVHNGTLDARKELIETCYTLLINRNDVINKASVSKCKKRSRDEIMQIISNKKEVTKKTWERYHQIGAITDKKWNSDKPLLENEERKKNVSKANKKLYIKNRDNILARNKEYFKVHYSKNKETRLQRGREHYNANKDEITAKQHEYYNQNKDAIAARQKKYYDTHKDIKKKYYEEHKDTINAHARERYAKKKKAEETNNE